MSCIIKKNLSAFVLNIYPACTFIWICNIDFFEDTETRSGIFPKERKVDDSF